MRGVKFQMCGRYMLHVDVEEILQHYGIVKGWITDAWAPEVFPSHKVPIVINQNQKELIPMKWGFVPPNGKGLIINSRGETVDAKPMFRRAFRFKRCIVPANAFFEWSKAGRDKTKYKFCMKNSSLFSMAGIYEDFQDEEGNLYKAFTVLTTRPNPLVSLIHDRMPVILPRDQEEVWLDHTIHDIPLLKSLIQPFNEAEMEMSKA
ncbi:MAG TPA: SOS response-associated peptidase [Clostridiales bacterium]|nr:SOS response-associated peptidase [Clostridiales bacterium]